VNLAAVNYHFGSKEGLLEAILIRSAQPMVEERLRLLAACAEGPGRPPMLEQLLFAFISPSLSLGREAGVDGVTFDRLRARVAVESDELYRRIVANAFDDSTKRFLGAFQAALPDLPPDLVAWRFHFSIGATIYTMANNGRIQWVTGGAVDPSDREVTLSRLLPFLAAAFRAPP